MAWQKWAILCGIAVLACLGHGAKKGVFLGCYKGLSPQAFHIQEYTNNCSEECAFRYYRYAFVRNAGQCICSNFLSEQASNETCQVFCPACDEKTELVDTFRTGNLLPGPPTNVQITNLTNTSLHLMWQRPKSFLGISSYEIKANVLHTYSSVLPANLEWVYSNNTFETNIINLLSATRYNITIGAKWNELEGPLVEHVVETLNGEPSNAPPVPIILSQDGKTMTISMQQTQNDNGPITSYQIVVIEEDMKQSFDKDKLGSFNVAEDSGLSYYITGEISPDDINKPFVVGDGRQYGRYHNVPLNPQLNYLVLVGVVSKLRGITKVAYSDLTGTQNGILILNNSQPRDDNPIIIVSLATAIAIFSLLLIVGLVGFMFLRKRVTNRRQRFTDNQELTMQIPVIEVENNGYIHEEPDNPNHYRNLRQKVRNFTLPQLNIDTKNFLGVGKFGRVNSGLLHDETEGDIPLAVYSIHDEGMSKEVKRGMLQELDMLIRPGRHDHLNWFLGTCETPKIVFVVLEHISTNLKDLLLGSRDSLPGRFSNLSEEQALDFAVQICKGMQHLEKNKIIHKQLCARSVLIADGFVAKIGNYGLAQYSSNNNVPDYTRWTALEVFKGQPHNPRSDVWSFGCLLWEICTLGGTPYGNVANNDIPKQITSGLRLPQMQYIGDEFYELMVDCWQLNTDERPNFNTLQQSIQSNSQMTVVPYLNFNLFSSFQYEQFYPDMELTARAVF